MYTYVIFCFIYSQELVTNVLLADHGFQITALEFMLNNHDDKEKGAVGGIKPLKEKQFDFRNCELPPLIILILYIILYLPHCLITFFDLHELKKNINYLLNCFICPSLNWKHSFWSFKGFKYQNTKSKLPALKGVVRQDTPAGRPGSMLLVTQVTE
jgi:hypothetical protein